MSRWMPRDLDAVDAQPLHALHAGACLGRRVRHGRNVEHRVVEDARPFHLSGVDPVAHRDGLARVAPDVAHAGDARGEPDLEFVLLLLRRAAALVLHVRVRVHETGEDVLPLGVDLDAARGASSIAADGVLNRVVARRDDLRNAVVVDDDVARPRRGRSHPVDHERVANDQAGVALAMYGRRLRAERDDRGE